MIRICRALLYSLFVLVIVPSAVSAQGKELEPVKIGYNGIGITHDLLKMMGSNRIFEKHGLSAQSVYFDAGPWERVAKSGIIDRLYGKALPKK